MSYEIRYFFGRYKIEVLDKEGKEWLVVYDKKMPFKTFPRFLWKKRRSEG